MHRPSASELFMTHFKKKLYVFNGILYFYDLTFLTIFQNVFSVSNTNTFVKLLNRRSNTSNKLKYEKWNIHLRKIKFIDSLFGHPNDGTSFAKYKSGIHFVKCYQYCVITQSGETEVKFHEIDGIRIHLMKRKITRYGWD